MICGTTIVDYGKDREIYPPGIECTHEYSDGILSTSCLESWLSTQNLPEEFITKQIDRNMEDPTSLITCLKRPHHS